MNQILTSYLLFFKIFPFLMTMVLIKINLFTKSSSVLVIIHILIRFSGSQVFSGLAIPDEESVFFLYKTITLVSC